MAQESRRKCGFRKVGATYLTGKGLAVSCKRLPFPITTCPHCGEGIKISRAMRLLSSTALFKDAKACPDKKCKCPLAHGESLGQVGLMLVGMNHYKKPEDFVLEAERLGVSKRIPRVPKGLEIGKTWVFLAHKKAVEIYANDTLLPKLRIEKRVPGVFYAFIPQAIEMLVDGTYSTAQRKELKERGFTLVDVPTDDPDHH